MHLSKPRKEGLCGWIGAQEGEVTISERVAGTEKIRVIDLSGYAAQQSSLECLKSKAKKTRGDGSRQRRSACREKAVEVPPDFPRVCASNENGLLRARLPTVGQREHLEPLQRAVS
ncbi:hypothetical protein cyc_04710 [Cyclospora cayetanensis]|uniref:Uncharacterized protein n=1 Tax=Cyclospora cayetanensis TaxID=88456 RepID=A0A1D3D514_9EIME|nr:hypothetical protein cyc_04710 [Cyclospora cayetanensis]